MFQRRGNLVLKGATIKGKNMLPIGSIFFPLRVTLIRIEKLEDLKVLRRSPDLLNNVKIGQVQLQLIMEQILFYH